jgi:pyrroline-5-carboxylate reductase
MANIGFIGTGEIASAMVKGLIGQGHQIYVSERGASFAAQLNEFAEVTVASNNIVMECADTVVLCLLRDVAHDVLPELAFRVDHKIISVMVDVSVDALTVLCAPAQDISVTIPLPSIEVGACPLPVYPDTGSVAELFGAKNPILPMASETALNAHFAATAMASVGFAQAQVAANWLAGHTGDAEAAETYLVSMLAGFFGSLPKDGQGRLVEALNALSTEGGLNATLRSVMKDQGAETALQQGLEGFEDRLGLK